MKERCIGWHSFETEMQTKQLLGSIEKLQIAHS